MGETETLEIDRYGDVTLQVGGETPDSQDERVSFVVCSRTLARVSPVFDRMLFGLFAESARNKEPQAAWVVELPEDKPTAMEVFLNIAHCRFDRIPAILSTDELYDLTVLTNSYDATPLLGPWAQGWMDFVNDIANDASRAMPKMLWISWELGCRDALNATARRLILESRGPLVGGPDWEDDLQTPPDIIGQLLER
jgi:hypothetical protein